VDVFTNSSTPNQCMHTHSHAPPRHLRSGHASLLLITNQVTIRVEQSRPATCARPSQVRTALATRGEGLVPLLRRVEEAEELKGFIRLIRLTFW